MTNSGEVSFKELAVFLGWTAIVALDVALHSRFSLLVAGVFFATAGGLGVARRRLVVTGKGGRYPSLLEGRSAVVVGATFVCLGAALAFYVIVNLRNPW